jgi:hypothetical protein
MRPEVIFTLVLITIMIEEDGTVKQRIPKLLHCTLPFLPLVLVDKSMQSILSNSLVTVQVP